MFLTIHKIKSRLKILSELRYYRMTDLFPFIAYDDLRSKDEVVSFPSSMHGPEFTINKDDFIVGRDRYIWADKKVNIPLPLDGFDVIGLFNFGQTNKWFNKGFESILYLNGKPYQGVDSYHNEVFFNPEYLGRETELKFMFWSGLEGDGAPGNQVMRANRAEIGYIHKKTDEFFYLSREIVNVYQMLEDQNPIKQGLLSALDRAFISIDLTEEREKLYEQIEGAFDELTDALMKLGSHNDVTVYCVGHSHIDLGWLWRVKHTKEKGLRSFSTVLRLMEQFEDYYFLQSQPQLYEFIKDNYPEVYENIKKRVMEGRFEPNGGMWVEADCNLISGESMVRQFLYGHKFISSEFGKKSDCLWLPDVFGYSHALPQVLKQCDIKTFMTTKISWNEYNRIPNDTFFWKGIDGTEILTHFITTPSEDFPEHYKGFTYNGEIDTSSVLGVWRDYKNKELSSDVVICFGYGDGGGGPTKDMMMRKRALEKIPSIPRVKTATISEYFDKLHNNIKNTREYIPCFANELYFENHRGTYTSQAQIKQKNRSTELALQRCEALAVFSQLYGGEFDAAGLEKVWKKVLLNQFHDILPGSSIREVYEDSSKDFDFCSYMIEKQNKLSLAVLTNKKENTWACFNQTGFERKDNVFVPELREGFFVDESGQRLKSDRVDSGYMVHLTLRPLGFTNLYFNEGEFTNVSSFQVKDKIVETPYYTVIFNEQGLITRLYDKEQDREVIGNFGNRLTVFEDININFDAWNLELYHIKKYEVIDNLVGFEVIHCGELELHIKLSFKYKKSYVEQIIKLYSHSRRIDFVTTADWHEKQKFLKAMFDVNVFATKATFDIQFGNVERPNHYSTSWDWAKFEVCAHKWMDMSENRYGVAILNNCKYGHSVKDSIMAISLIKCPINPDAKADEGIHNFTYSLLPHKDNWRQSCVQQQAEYLNTPIMAVKGEMPAKSLFKFSTDSISVDTVKPSEDGKAIILRVHEYMGGTEKLSIKSDFSIQSIERVNMLEEGHLECSTEEWIKPYEIKNYYIKLTL